MVLPEVRRPRPFWTVADPPVGRRDTTHGAGHTAPLERPSKLVPAVVWVSGVTCRSVAGASDGAGAAPTAMTSGYPAGRGSQLMAVGAASLAGVRRRTAATPAGSLAGGRERLVTLMPLVGRAAVDGYLRSVALWLAQRQGLGEAEQEQADLASMGIRAETVTLGDAPLARTLGTLLASTGARP